MQGPPAKLRNPTDTSWEGAQSVGLHTAMPFQYSQAHSHQHHLYGKKQTDSTEKKRAESLDKKG